MSRILRNPSTQNAIAGVCVGFSAGIFVSLNLLGAGGGRPDSAQVVQIANAVLSSVWFLSGCFGRVFLKSLGPSLTISAGVFTYALYVGSLWYFEEAGQRVFPILAGAFIGVGAGMTFTTAGYIQVAYPEEKQKGEFIAIQNNLQAFGSIMCSLLPVILNRNNATRAGVPRAIYLTFIIVMCCVAALALLTIHPPEKLRRPDGSVVAVDKHSNVWTELKANLHVFKDWKLVLMIPAFLPAGSFLIYNGSVNAYHNDLRSRSLLSFVAVAVQIPCGYGLHKILDNTKWRRRTRGIVGLTVVAVPLMGAWIWEIARVGHYDRSKPPAQPLDWRQAEFGWVMVLFILNWVSSSLWQYVVPWIIGALTNSPVRLSHYMGVWRGFLAAGEAICFSVDSVKIPYRTFAGGILTVYSMGIVVLFFLTATQVEETCYFKEGEQGVVVPNYIREKTTAPTKHAPERPMMQIAAVIQDRR